MLMCRAPSVRSCVSPQRGGRSHRRSRGAGPDRLWPSHMAACRQERPPRCWRGILPRRRRSARQGACAPDSAPATSSSARRGACSTKASRSGADPYPSHGGFQIVRFSEQSFDVCLGAAPHQMPASSMAGPKFDQPGLAPNLGAQGSDLDDNLCFRLRLWPLAAPRGRDSICSAPWPELEPSRQIVQDG